MRNLLICRYVDTIARTGSIRQAAEQLAITPSALNRRILALEDELGVQLFERLGRGVRLSTAGEIVVDVFRKQLADIATVRSRLADLSGLRRGHVTVASSQALLPFFLPEQIRRYQSDFPLVTFSVLNKDGAVAGDALRNYAADLAIVFEPLSQSDCQTLFSAPQPIHAVMSRDHPLADKETLHLSDCLGFPLALPTRAYALRQILQAYADRLSVTLEPSVEAESYILLRNFVAEGTAISFELRIGVPPDKMGGQLVSRPLKTTRSPVGSLQIVQLKERTLSVAAARFAQQVTEALVDDQAV
jgi:DNA-binding transcriptional LysR family regulator